jgi:hypothetical protein
MIHDKEFEKWLETKEAILVGISSKSQLLYMGWQAAHALADARTAQVESERDIAEERTREAEAERDLLRKAIEDALECAGGRWCEWGIRAGMTESILHIALKPPARKPRRKSRSLDTT